MKDVHPVTRPRVRLAAGLLAVFGLSCAATKPPARSISAPAAAQAIVELAQAGIAIVVAVSPVWKGWQPRQVPFAIVGPKEQWLFQSLQPPRGYDAVVYSSALGPVYRAPSLTRADGTRASSPSTFFARTSVADDDIVFLIMGPDAPLPGRNEPLSLAEWTQVFVHEYFHTYQMRGSEWAGDVKLCDDARPVLDRRYADPDFRKSIGEELELERALILEVAREHRLDRTALAPLLAHRARRRARLGALAAAESALEKVEGSARFVDQTVFMRESTLRELRRIDPSIAPWSLDRALAEGLAIGDHRYWYATGYGLVLLLEALGPSWHDELAGRDLAELLDEELARGTLQ